jgi:hypothetical protein
MAVLRSLGVLQADEHLYKFRALSPFHAFLFEQLGWYRNSFNAHPPVPSSLPRGVLLSILKSLLAAYPLGAVRPNLCSPTLTLDSSGKNYSSASTLQLFQCQVFSRCFCSV